ncbi:MAG: ferritin-like domain-containing protein [Gammaproteobacteria bacterium]
MNAKNKFILDLDKIKQTAEKEVRQKELRALENSVNAEDIIQLLNHSLATEIICVHRYKKHYFTATDLGEHVIGEEFLEHAKEEQDHADKLAKRIAQLGGEPEYDPLTIQKTAHTEYKACDTIEEMLIENLIAERIAVMIYREIIRFTREKDPVTTRLLEEILAVEEEHVDDLCEFLNKKKYFLHGKINDLKNKAEALVNQMMKEEKENGNAVTVFEHDIGEIVNTLNQLDKEKNYDTADFIPKT